jgi:CBS domain-containing protein
MLGRRRLGTRGAALRRTVQGRLGRQEEAPMNVEAILRSKGDRVVTIALRATIAVAVATLRREGVGALVASEDGVTVDGVLSERDIVQGLANLGTALLDDKVETLMTRRVFTCTPRDSIADLAAEMTQRRIRHIPVLRDGALAGIVSIGDVVKARLDEMEYETSSLRSFIAGAS